MSWAPVVLGAYHGLNPAMGWLFAVALGLQERRSAAVLRALPPIALGHGVSVAAVLLLFAGAAQVVPESALRLAAAGALFAFSAYLWFGRRRHPRGGMRMGFRELTLWSFLMSSAHGAGLMLLPVMMHSHHGHGGGLGVFGVHTLAMFASMTAISLVVFSFVGVDFLRRAWVNLDAVWIGALVVAGVVTLA
jgi:hypothetical protein